MSDEEQGLDSFFAKKDKNKKTKKGKKKTKSSEKTETQSETATVKQVKDEWNDFEEKKEKDYSSLKIQDLQVTDEPSREEFEEELDDCDDIDGERVSADKKIWKASNPTENHTPNPVPEPVNTPNVVSGKYVPPSMKRAQMGATTTAGPRRRPGVAPDIKSQAAFPTLGAANQELSSGKMPSDFEPVKRGTRTNDARMESSRPSLNLDNRYTGLRS